MNRPPSLRALGGADVNHIIHLPWLRPPITLNGGLRADNPYLKAKRVRAAKDDAIDAILNAGVPPLPGANITLHYRVPDKRRRDADNLAGTLKVCADALVEIGVLYDDSWICVPSATCRIHPPVKGQPPALWLELTEIDEEIEA